MFEELRFSYETMVQLALLIIAIATIYIKLMIDLTKVRSLIQKNNDEMNLKIAEIVSDRQEKWIRYEARQKVNEECLKEIMEGVNNVRGNVEAIKTDISWLKKN